MAQSGLPKYKALILERDGPLTWLTLNRPEKLNAMNSTLRDELSVALDVLAGHEETRVVAIRGAGRAFSAGFDIERSDSDGEADVDIVDDYETHVGFLNQFLKIWDHPKPVIAAVHGYCLAGATQLCVFCDITVVAEDAVIGLPSMPMGGGYITPLWVPLVGPKRAKQMSFVAGSKISGKTASDWGWANYAVPATELEDNVRQLAWSIARIPARTLRMKKLAINRVADIMGFRNIVPMGAETDALLHYSGAVKDLFESIQKHGLKEAIARFNASGSSGEPSAPR
jgi:enoyl-CoA hydratase/carnithine racemase